MIRALLASFSLSFVLLLGACGGDSSGTAAAGPSKGGAGIASVAVKGVIESGVVRLQRWQAGAYSTIATTTTAADGSFSFPGFSPVPGELLKLVLGVDASTQMICDAESCLDAAGQAKTFGQSMSVGTDLQLSSWVSVSAEGEVTVMPITPVSTLLVSYAEVLGGGHLKAPALSAARQHVAALFRLTPEELLAQPGNIASSVWAGSLSLGDDKLDPRLKITLLAAAFAELAGGDAKQLQTVIKNYSQSFIDNNGRLMELDETGTVTLAKLFGAVNTSVALATLPAVQNKADAWLQDVVSVLKSGELSSICQGSRCAEAFDSQRFVDALGPLGEDVKYVLSNSAGHYSSIEHMLAGELNKFGWLAQKESIALAATATKTLTFSVQAMLTRLLVEFLLVGFPGEEADRLAFLNLVAPELDAIGDLTPTMNGNVLTVTGSEGDLEVNLQVTLPALLIPMSGSKQFAFGLKGYVRSEEVQGDVDASVVIDAAKTDFTALMAALTAAKEALTDLDDKDEGNDAAALDRLSGVMTVAADLAKSAQFNVEISADKFRFAKGDSMLAIEGSGSVAVKMDGGLLQGHRILLDGEVEEGRVTLPNGSWFQIGEDDHLTFSMNKDGEFDALFDTHLLTLFRGTATGKLANMGVTVSNLRDSIVNQIKASEFDLLGMLAQLLTDVSTLDLRVTADVNIVEEGSALAGKRYQLAVHNTDLTVNQPDSDEVALTAGLSLSGLMISAGNAWWLFAPDLQDWKRPGVLISDDTGAGWRYRLDLGELVAGL